MRFAFPPCLIAALSFISLPAGATPAEEPPPDLPPEAPFPRTRAGIGLDLGFAYVVPQANGPAALLSFRCGRRFNDRFSVYYQGSPFVLWDPKTTQVSGGIQNSALAAFTFSDRVELAVGPALDTSVVNPDSPTADVHRITPLLAPGVHARGSVAIYRMRDTDRAPMGLFLGLELHLVVPILPPAPIPVASVAGGVGWEWY